MSIIAATIAALLLCPSIAPGADALWAGVAKRDITDRNAGPVNDPLYVKALVLRSGQTSVALLTLDVVALGEIGRIDNRFVGNVRSEIEKELNIPARNILLSASHCHGLVRRDTATLAVQAMKEAAQKMTPVMVGAGVGREDRIMENRRLRMKDGSEIDVRRAYSLPPDRQVAGLGPVDPQIGVLRIDRENGRPLAVVYHFACHPIEGVPSNGNSADIPGFASKVIEDTLGDAALAFFVQGCAGDINPVRYKNVHSPHDAEPLGNLLGLAAMRAVQDIRTRASAELKIESETLALPRGTDSQARIAAAQVEQTRLLHSLKGTDLNLKNFMALYSQYKMSGEFPAADSLNYLQEQAIGRDDLKNLDAENRKNIAAYVDNILIMEQLTRIHTNIDLLKLHQAQHAAAGKQTIDAELTGLRVGDFVLVGFPGELSVEIGLGIKRRAPRPFTFISGCTNGYIYYTPTAKQCNNKGWAQEDCDCLVAPEWQKMFEDRVMAILQKL
jgi:hypothetical protein